MPVLEKDMCVCVSAGYFLLGVAMIISLCSCAAYLG